MKQLGKLPILWIGLWLSIASTFTASAASTPFPQQKISIPMLGSYVGGEMGQAVAIDSNTMIVGAPYAASYSGGFGMAWIFKSNGMGGWDLQAQIPRQADGFGRSVCISGDIAVVGAYGNANIYVRSNGVWTQQMRLYGSLSDRWFGCSVSVCGETVVVGSENYGYAYVYKRSGSDWTLQAVLTAPNAKPNARFGHSVSISGDTIVVGACNDEAAMRYSGAAYVFVLNGTKWTQQAKLTASDAGANNQFGQSVSIFGNTVVIGADGDDVAGYASGSAYVFTRNGTAWSEQSKIGASDAAGGAHFGASVSLASETAVIGADRSGAGNAGAAYVFTRSGTIWSQQQRLQGHDAKAADFFGSSVATCNGIAVVGACGDDTTQGMDSGSAYVFTRSSGLWSEQTKVTATDPIAGDQAGDNVAVSGSTVIIGAPAHTMGGTSPGAAYAFSYSSNKWVSEGRLSAVNANPSSKFGCAVAVLEDTAIIGASEDDGAAQKAGCAYGFSRVNGVWSQHTKFCPGGGRTGDNFGCSISISGNSVLFGAKYNDTPRGPYTGSAYIFTYSGKGWPQEAQLLESPTTANSEFGISVGLSGNTAAIGAHLANNESTRKGRAFVYTRAKTTWTQQAILDASDGAPNDDFGRSIAICGDTIIVGAPLVDHDGCPDAGAAYIFTRNGVVWTQQTKLIPSKYGVGNRFGCSVSITGNVAVIGSEQGDEAANNAGVAFVFTRDGSKWNEISKLIASDAAVGDFFSHSVAASVGKVIVGAPYDDDPLPDSGSAYVFDLGSLFHSTRADDAWSLYK